MSVEQRKLLISELEKKRKSHLLVYFTGDRHPLISARIAEDAVRPLHEHLLASSSANGNAQPKVDLFLYSRGGDVSVPWRIISMLREYYEEIEVLIPYKAHSATTMISLGADKILMGKKAELGPIDPTLMRATVAEATNPPPEISVEDVSSYISFMRDRAGITDQNALCQVVSQLANHLGPLTLGSVNRQYSHIRLVARKLLTSRKQKMEEEKVAAIIDALTEKMYSHGHAIGRKEAIELGLPVEKPEFADETLMWKLYQEYESMLNLCEPFDPQEILTSKKIEEYTEQSVPLAVIESAKMLHIFETNISFSQRRNVPANPQININLNLALPAGINPTQIPANMQGVINQILTQVSAAIPGLVRDELVRQSPVLGIEIRNYGGKWRKIA